jgi:hypothetical protein
VTVEEMQVFAAVLDEMAKQKLVLQPLIADRTSSFECKSCNGMEMGCGSGLRDASETPQDALSRVRTEMPDLLLATSVQFEERNAECAVLSGTLPAATKHYLFSLTDDEVNKQKPAEWKHPDLVYFSRAAFDPQRTQALVFMVLGSGTDASLSGGDYILLSRIKGQWRVEDTLPVWDLVPQEAPVSSERDLRAVPSSEAGGACAYESAHRDVQAR